MSIELPQDLLSLEANSGIYAIWMIFHHYGIDLHIPDLVQLTRHNDEMGTSTIALAVALKTLGLDAEFLQKLILINSLLKWNIIKRPKNSNYLFMNLLFHMQKFKKAGEGRFVIVFYDTLDRVGNHSLIYAIDEQEISFFDSFEAMPAHVFEQQRRVDGICQQAIVIDDRNFVMRNS